MFRSRAILILDITAYAPHMVELLKPYAREYVLEIWLSDLFDYCVARTIHEYYLLNVNGLVVNSRLSYSDNDLFAVIYDEVKYRFYLMIKKTLDSYNVTFHQGDQVKLLVTYGEIVMVRYPRT